MKRPNWLKPAPTLVLGLLVVGITGLGWIVVCLPQLQTASLSQKIKGYETSPKPDPEKLANLEKGRIDSENAIRTGLIQGLGGTAVLVGIYFTYRNLKTAEANLKATQRNVLIAEDKQVTERFSKAVDMLSSSNIHTRLGGIYALERIANDSDKDYPQVMEVLTAFVREESPYPPKKADPTGAPTATIEENEIPPLRTDIQAVMTVIGRRKHRYGDGEWETQRLDLRKTDLRKLYAYETNLTGLILSDTRLEGANLYGAHLERTDLSRAHLEGAYLETAHLKRATLMKANLYGAFLSGADLSEAYMIGTYLEGTDLERVDLSQTIRLTQEQINEAITNETTVLPSHLHAPQSQPSQPAIPLPFTAPEPASELPPESTGTNT